MSESDSDSSSASKASSYEATAECDGDWELPDSKVTFLIRITTRFPRPPTAQQLLKQFSAFGATSAYQDGGANNNWLVEFPSQAQRNNAIGHMNHRMALGAMLIILSEQREPVTLSAARLAALDLRRAALGSLSDQLVQAVGEHVDRVFVTNLSAKIVDRWLATQAKARVFRMFSYQVSFLCCHLRFVSASTITFSLIVHLWELSLLSTFSIASLTLNVQTPTVPSAAPAVTYQDVDYTALAAIKMKRVPHAEMPPAARPKQPTPPQTADPSEGLARRSRKHLKRDHSPVWAADSHQASDRDDGSAVDPDDEREPDSAQLSRAGTDDTDNHMTAGTIELANMSPQSLPNVDKFAADSTLDPEDSPPPMPVAPRRIKEVPVVPKKKTGPKQRQKQPTGLLARSF